ncbi:hypothetical protein HH303_11375 [Rhodospirillaceae bacterium KN72]|uniref:N-acetyltransferase domain-containing protein n=1 Tax=Pacificispira spongiicola TaxID=2729598 RepID=A0A7Y0HGL4_9PROT|nr:hypothetical protein [Pacificispira spongiicola]NMM45082.1 hypothetical protein [Pacificispira spongiicola]
MTANRIAQALPLAQTLRSDLTLTEWEAFCGQRLHHSDSDAGMDIVTDGDGYLLGLAAYQIRTDIRHGRVLDVDPFIAMDVYGRDRACEMLLEHIESLATDRACGAVHVSLEGVDGRFPRRCGTSFTRILESGYRADGLRLCKGISQPANGN